MNVVIGRHIFNFTFFMDWARIYPFYMGERQNNSIKSFICSFLIRQFIWFKTLGRPFLDIRATARKLYTRPAMTWTAVSTIIRSHQQALGNLTNEWTPVGLEPNTYVVKLIHFFTWVTGSRSRAIVYNLSRSGLMKLYVMLSILQAVVNWIYP